MNHNQLQCHFRNFCLPNPYHKPVFKSLKCFSYWSPHFSSRAMILVQPHWGAPSWGSRIKRGCRPPTSQSFPSANHPNIILSCYSSPNLRIISSLSSYISPRARHALQVKSKLFLVFKVLCGLELEFLTSFVSPYSPSDILSFTTLFPKHCASPPLSETTLLPLPASLSIL